MNSSQTCVESSTPDSELRLRQRCECGYAAVICHEHQSSGLRIRMACRQAPPSAALAHQAAVLLIFSQPSMPRLRLHRAPAKPQQALNPLQFHHPLAVATGIKCSLIL